MTDRVDRILALIDEGLVSNERQSSSEDGQPFDVCPLVVTDDHLMFGLPAVTLMSSVAYHPVGPCGGYLDPDAPPPTPGFTIEVLHS